MFASLAFLSLVAAPAMGPMLPPGMNPAFQLAVLAVEDKLSVSDFSGAGKALRLLPKRDVVVQWDDSKVPAEQRAEFAAQRDKAIKDWIQISTATITLGTKNPDIKFSFEPVLAESPTSGIPAGAALFWSETPTDPRLETVIGLKRGIPAEPIAPANVHNEVVHALGAYFGLASSPFPGTYMGRTDVNYQQESHLSPIEMSGAQKAMAVVDVLREAVQKHTPLIPTRPKAFIDTKAIDLGTVLQGQRQGFEIQVSNTGNAPLAIRLQPDCGCITTTRYEEIQPGGSFVVKGAYDTMLSVGQIRHTLLVATNDGDNSVLTVPFMIHVKPSYRFLMPAGDVVLLPEEGTTVTAYLAVTEGADIVPTDVQVSGLEGDVSFEPWSGKLADPQMNEPEMPRKGYKISVKLSGKMPVPGRAPVTLWMTTKSTQFPQVQTNFFVQRGIVALPLELFMGDIGASPRKFSLVVSGPSNGFKINKVTSDWPNLTFEVYPNSDGTEYRVMANYDGKGAPGPVKGTVVIETDNPKQPKILVPIKATVK